MISDTERVNHLQWRIKRLENLIGKSSKMRIIETITNLNEQVLDFASNNSLTARKLVYRADQINRLTNPNFQRYIDEDRLAICDLVLADEARIRSITENLSEIEVLARVLDERWFTEIPKLFANLNRLLAKYEHTKNEHRKHTDELSHFLQDYATFTLLMDENLHRYKSMINEDHHVVSSDSIE
ncbi:unnamed protein product [Adineta ricciae]|uniref:Uncharacterized protein n=1 Tax=Adineta ricciae TaxID=249248 RepID=A0A815GM38_ADIRI|nr:unnamed protein product [Adineta ricciae]CAF1340358.1 unnamed protein product [Adineta ricciae]